MKIKKKKKNYSFSLNGLKIIEQNLKEDKQYEYWELYEHKLKKLIFEIIIYEDDLSIPKNKENLIDKIINKYIIPNKICTNLNSQSYYIILDENEKNLDFNTFQNQMVEKTNIKLKKCKTITVDNGYSDKRFYVDTFKNSTPMPLSTGDVLKYTNKDRGRGNSEQSQQKSKQNRGQSEIQPGEQPIENSRQTKEQRESRRGPSQKRDASEESKGKFTREFGRGRGRTRIGQRGNSRASANGGSRKLYKQEYIDDYDYKNEKYIDDNDETTNKIPLQITKSKKHKILSINKKYKRTKKLVN